MIKKVYLKKGVRKSVGEAVFQNEIETNWLRVLAMKIRNLWRKK